MMAWRSRVTAAFGISFRRRCFDGTVPHHFQRGSCCPSFSTLTTSTSTSRFPVSRRPASVSHPSQQLFLSTDASSSATTGNDDRKTTSTPPPALVKKDDKPWIVPERINIPMDRIEMSFVRASGAGGQNVNKVSTKVELKFLVDGANWLPKEVRDRIKEQQASRMTNDGYLRLSVQEHRTQSQNRKTAFDKLEEMILEAYPRPKERNLRTGISEQTKRRNVADKRKRSEVKQNRKQVNDW